MIEAALQNKKSTSFNTTSLFVSEKGGKTHAE